MTGDIAGIAVNIAARTEAHANSGQVVVTQTMREMLMDSAFDFSEIGEHTLKGVDGVWKLHRVDLT